MEELFCKHVKEYNQKDPNKIITIFKETAFNSRPVNGDDKENYWYAKILNCVGCAYFDLKKDIKDYYKTAVQYWLEAAKLGNTSAACNVGIHCKAIEMDEKLAVKWLFFAFERDRDQDAELEIIKYNTEQRRLFFCTASKCYTLLKEELDIKNNFYSNGRHVYFADYLIDRHHVKCEECETLHSSTKEEEEENDIIIAKSYLYKAAENGSKDACYSLGNLFDPYFRSAGLKQDKNLIESLKWYIKAIGNGVGELEEIIIKNCFKITHLDKKDICLVNQIIHAIPKTIASLLKWKIALSSHEETKSWIDSRLECGNLALMNEYGLYLLSIGTHKQDKELGIRYLHQAATLQYIPAKQALSSFNENTIYQLMFDGIDVEFLFYYVPLHIVHALVEKCSTNLPLMRILIYDYGINPIQSNLLYSSLWSIQELINDLMMIYQYILDPLFFSRDLSRIVCTYLSWFNNIIEPLLQRNKKRKFELVNGGHCPLTPLTLFAN